MSILKEVKMNKTIKWYKHSESTFRQTPGIDVPDVLGVVDDEVVVHLQYELRDGKSVWTVNCLYEGGTVVGINRTDISNLRLTMNVIEKDYAEYSVRQEASVDLEMLNLPEAGADLVLQLKKYGGPHYH